MYYNKTIAAVIPAHNEQASIALVLKELKALSGPDKTPLFDDILVCDNASTDNTPTLAKQAGVRVIYEPQKGYGIACQTAISALRNPDIVVFIDADHSIVAEEVPRLLAPLRKGADLVIGSRTLGNQEANALLPPQRIGNWLASYTIRRLWHYQITDLGPFRAICYRSLKRLQMQDQHYGWTVEMQVKAIQHGMTVVETPVSSLERIGKSKISGTLRGCIGAAIGIFGTIFKLYARQIPSLPSPRLKE